ncbi:MAG: hypothetical protein EBR82_40120 [Caulobacteraceae bacterium]|nr:hypothetical protein [Caulobacteraceae bacterium]
MNDAVVLDALAAHYRAATPPTGETIRFVSAYPVEAIPATPAIVLFEGSDSITYGAASRNTTIQVQAILYLPALEYARQYARISTLRAWMRDSLLDGVLLDGTSGVGQASVVSTTTDSSDYGEAPFITVTANIEITGVEAIAPTA